MPKPYKERDFYYHFENPKTKEEEYELKKNFTKAIYEVFLSWKYKVGVSLLISIFIVCLIAILIALIYVIYF